VFVLGKLKRVVGIDILETEIFTFGDAEWLANSRALLMISFVFMMAVSL